jgi:hypothetical protein
MTLVTQLQVTELLKYRTNSVALSPQVNYTDWETATGRRILVSTFVDRGLSRGQRSGTPTADLNINKVLFVNVIRHRRGLCSNDGHDL